MKTILITGASGNMGQALVKKFLTEGWKVAGTFVPNDPVKPEFNHPSFTGITVDLMNEADAASMVQQLVQKSRVDAAVLTVGGFAMGDIASTSSAGIMQQYKLNFETAYHVARPLLTQMMQQHNGRIFVVGSRPGMNMKNSKGMTAYGLAKSLIFRLAELMNEEAANSHVKTFVIVPSTIDTPQNRAAMPGADISKWVTPQTIADTVFDYCSDGGAEKEMVIEL